MRLFILGHIFFIAMTVSSCQGGGMGGGSEGGNAGNEGGSEPVNPTEERAYKRAILKCYKTGGSRVVKIEGQLMCY